MIGCSLAWHLAELGHRDVLLLEQGRLTSGTTWHAAGLVGQMRPNRAMTRMSRYGVELYRTLEARTGLATGWKACGSVNVARTADRWTVYRRQAALARSFGIDVHEISPAEAGALWPLMRTDDLRGALWFPADGKANPTDLTQSLARGARDAGVRIVEGVHVARVTLHNGAVTGVRTDQGDVACEVFANCAGQWARELGQRNDGGPQVAVPLYSAEHFYLVTAPIEGIHPDLPVMRDPDGYVYFKEEVGGLVMGGFEPAAKTWLPSIPRHFEFQLLPEDWDQFEVLMRHAIERVPALQRAGIKMLLNGPESFTPDGNFILGESPDVRNYFVAAGFNSAGIANAGGAGRLLAQWIDTGESPMDLSDVDIRRFGAGASNLNWLRDRTVETLGLHYAMRWPRQELESGRGQRRSPLHDRLAARGAVFGSKMGWERANWFAPPGDATRARHTLGRPGWLDACNAEQRAVRGAVGMFDQSSFGKLLVTGRDALALLQRVCANEIDVPPGRVVYTPMLDARGGFVSDLTVQRVAPDEFMLVTGSAQPVRDAAWLRRHRRDTEHVHVLDVSNAWSVVSVMGPRAAELLSGASGSIVDEGGFAVQTFRAMDIGYATVRAARVSYVGGPGWELYVPVEMACALYDTLRVAGEGLGLRDCGYYCLDALRIEAGRRAFPGELSPDVNPWEAGLGFAVRPDKAAAFVGQAALRAVDRSALARRLVVLRFDAVEPWPYGGEPIIRDGEPVGELSSVAYSDALSTMVGIGLAHWPQPVTREAATRGTWQVDIAGRRVPAQASLTPAWP